VARTKQFWRATTSSDKAARRRSKYAELRSLDWSLLSLQQSRFSQRCQKILFYVRVPFAGDRWPGDKHQVYWMHQFEWVTPVRFAQQSSRAIAHDRPSDFA
jgi:hypothetical protein